jgi:hypothetical protein
VTAKSDSLRIKTTNRDIDSFSASDFELICCDAHKKIPMKMAVWGNFAPLDSWTIWIAVLRQSDGKWEELMRCILCYLTRFWLHHYITHCSVLYNIDL